MCPRRSYAIVSGVGHTVTEEEKLSRGVMGVMAASSVSCVGFPSRLMRGFRAKRGEIRPNCPLCCIAISSTTAAYIIITRAELPSRVIGDGGLALGMAVSRGSCRFSCSAASDGGTTNVSLAMSGAVTVCSYGCITKACGLITAPTAVVKIALPGPVRVLTCVER